MMSEVGEEEKSGGSIAQMDVEAYLPRSNCLWSKQHETISGPRRQTGIFKINLAEIC